MIHPLKKVVLVGMAASMAVSAFPHEKNMPVATLSGLLRAGTPERWIPNHPARKAGPVWKQIGSTHYSYAGSMGGDTWNFQSRDTIMYNAKGNIVIQKSSYAQTGWETDSLQLLDSSVYIDGNITEEVCFFYNLFGGIITNWGFRSTYTYPDGGKCVAGIIYDWVDSIKSWKPVIKDSIFLSMPVSGFMNDLDFYYGYLAGMCFYIIDTLNILNESWINVINLRKIEAECGATTLVLGGRESVEGTTDFREAKFIYTFKATKWTEKNLTEMRRQVKNPSTGAYYDANKTVYTPISKEEYDWDTTAKVWTGTKKDFNFPDARGNDTLSYICRYDTLANAWDTNSMYRYERTYDVNGNNRTTIRSYYNPLTKKWILTGKDVNVFAQIDIPVIHPGKPRPRHSISMTAAGSRLRFSAPEITSLTLYNASGRLVASIGQRPASSISLDVSNLPARVSSGVYTAELVSRHGRTSFIVPIRR